MNKQEAIEKVKNLNARETFMSEIIWVKRDDVLDIIKQLDELEKLYTVEIPNPNAGGHVVLCKTSDGIVSIAFTGKARWQGCKNFQLTEAEIKQDFDWAWQFAKEVEE